MDRAPDESTVMAPGHWEVHRRREVESTQDALSELLPGHPRSHVVVIAERQTRGRGRRGNSWLSPPGGLWCSLSWMLDRPPDPFVGLLLARAARDAVGDLLGPAGALLRVKWPNDLVVNERKWGGVLADARAASAGTLLLLGLGLNLQVRGDQLPPPDDRPWPATSIEREFACSPSPEEALSLILERFEALAIEDAARGREHSRRGLSAVLATLGREILWEDLLHGTQRGRAESLEPDGALRVRLADGSPRVLRSGDIHHLRNCTSDA